MRYLIICLTFIIPLTQVVSQETVLNSTSNITIETGENLGNADVVLKDILKQYLLRVLKKEKLTGKGNSVKFILKARAPRWQELDLNKIKRLNDIDAFEIDTSKSDTVTISGSTALATGYGLMYFLEHYLGVFWLFPGDLGTCIPDVKEVRLPIGIKKVAPDVISRIYTGVKYHAPEVRQIRLKLPYKGVVQNRGIFFKTHDALMNLKLHPLIHASHNMINIFPVNECKEKYPEIFPVKNGKLHIPDPKKHNIGHGQCWHPCYTNPKTIEVATRKAKEYFKNRTGLVYSLGINDGTRLQCQCDTCKKVGFPESYYQFVNKVADNVKDFYPPCMIGVLAYGDVGVPPVDLKLPENVLVLSTSGIKRWTSHAQNLGSYEYIYGWGYWVPNLRLQTMKKNVELYKKHGVIATRSEIGPVWAFDGPKLYIHSNLLWNTDFDVKKGLMTYCKKGYGASWQEVLKLYKMWSAYRDKDIKTDGLSPTWGGGMDFRKSTQQYSQVPGKMYLDTRKLLEQAAKKAKKEIVKKRLAMLNAFFTYSETYYKLYHLSRKIYNADQTQSWVTIAAEVNGLVEKRLKLIEEMKEHKEWFKGTGQTIEQILALYGDKKFRGHFWEGRWEWTLDYESENALRTALFQVNKRRLTDKIKTDSILPAFRMFLKLYNTSPVKFSIFDAWLNYYHPDIHNQLEIFQTENEGTYFKISRYAPKKVPEDTKYQYLTKNGLKKFWFRGNCKLDPNDYYLFELDLTAKDGKAHIYICNENDCGKKVYIIEDFRSYPERRCKKEILLKPFPFWGRRSKVSNWSVAIVFTPNSEKAKFKGSCKIKKVDFENK